MTNYVPHYYKDFKCIADKCKESCCIGWEIDIDDDTLEMYKCIGGDMGHKLQNNITVSEDGSICFKLGENERCPFLNKENLCELILYGGENMLCDICHMHPRFVNCFSGRCETGIGLCCEEAARIILNDTAPMTLEAWDDDDETEVLNEAEEFLFEQREQLWKKIEQSCSVSSMAEMLLESDQSYITGYERADRIHSPSKHMHSAIELICRLEPLNDLWTEVCGKLSDIGECEYDERELQQYKNLLKYYILRYFVTDANAGYPALSMAVFAADAVTYIKKATGMSFTDSVCLWSKETEYSAENMDMIYDHLACR